ncbi:MAG UNVERIFIED_CONTAM: hypothetical protein LVR18_12440 [Planctomycetaceae bacterium]
MNGVPGRPAANVRSRPSALHSRTVYDDCGEFREWTDCSEFHAKVTGPGSPPPVIFHASTNADPHRFGEGQSLGKRDGTCCCEWSYSNTNRHERRAWTTGSQRQKQAVGFAQQDRL